MKRLLSSVLALAMMLGFADVLYAAAYEAKTVEVYFDGSKMPNASVIHCSDSNDYPCIALEDLASAIGGTLTGNTLTKDKVTISFTEGSRIARFTHADYPNRADYMTTYYSNTSNILTDESSYKLSSVAKSLILGETTDKSLLADYINDGTDGENDGYILEYAPFSYNSRLYVPLYSIVPTLNYHTEYFRFDSNPKIEITTGAKELSSYQTFYAKDYGAAGDGVTDDKDAILKGFYDAVMYEGPSKFVLEEGEIYRVGERMDFEAFFYLYDKDDFVFDGNGSTILFSTPVNGAINVRSCKNIIFKDLTLMYDEHTSTHGQIESVGTYDSTNKECSFVMKIAETVEVPADKAWMDNKGGKAYGFGQAYDIASKRAKFILPDHFDIRDVEGLGGKRVRITISGSTAQYVNKLKPGDGFVMNNRADGYDTDGITAGITLFLSRDIELDGVVLCGSHELGIAVGLCDGNITFRNYKMLTKEGTATATSADGIHCYRNRATLLVEDSELWNNLDDHINTKGEYGQVSEISDKTITVSNDQLFKPGDEIWFMVRDNTNTKNTSVGRAYVKEVLAANKITLDRAVPTEISNLAANPEDGKLPILYNNMAAGGGTCIRGTRFIASRRHAYISRSRNTIFMNNYIQNNGGSTCDAADEIGTSEGPFPDSFTIRNNRTYGDGITESSTVPGVIAVRAFRYPTAYDIDASEREINGALIQGNIIQVNTGRCSIFVNSVKDLYMSNNRILWNDSWTGTEYDYGYTNYKPVYISNCEIKEFTNLTYDGPTVSNIVTTKNCDGTVDESEIN